MADYSQYLQPPAEPQTALAEQQLNPVSTPGDYSAFLTPPPAEQTSPTGLTQEPAPGWQKGFAVLTDRLTTGGAQFNQAAAGLMLTAGASMEEADQTVNDTALQEAQQRREDFVNTHAYQNLFKLRDLPWEDKNNPEVFNLADLPGMAIEQVPMLAATAGIGMTGGAMAGAVFGTEALATAGVLAAMTPVGLGALAGGALLAGTVMYGSHVYEQMKRGVPKEHAIMGGIISGAIGGVATTVGLGALGHLLPGAAEVVFNNKGFRNSVGELATMMAKGAGIDTSAGFIQSSVDAALKYAETHATKVENPVTLAEVLREIAGGTAQSLVLSPVIGGVTTGVGIAAGKSALKKQAQMDTAISAFNARMEKLVAAHEQIVAEEKAKRDAETAEKTTIQQTKARRQLKGFVEVDRTLEATDAQNNYDEAVAQHKADPSTLNKAAVNQAKAELQHAKYSAHLGALEDALTDPDLLNSVAAKRQELEGRLQVLQEHRDAAQMPSEKEAFDNAISTVKADITLVKNLEGLGSPEAMRQQIEQMKTQLQGHVDQTRLQVAHKALEHRMETRAVAIEALRKGIREHKVAAKDTDIPAFTADKRARLEQLQEQQELDQVIHGMLEAGELESGDIKTLSPEAPTARLKGLAELAQRKVEQAAKVGGREQKKLMKAAKKLLDAVVNFSRLPAADKAKLKAQYATADAETLTRDLPKLQAQINETFNKRRLEAARKDLKAAIGNIKVDPTVASKFPEVENQLEHLKKFATDADAIEAFLEKIDGKETLTEDEMAILELTKLFPDEPDKLTATQLEAILDTVVSLKETGKAEALRRTEERRARQQGKYERVVEAMGNRKRKTGIKAQLDRILYDKAAAEVKTWRGLMVMVTQFGEATDLADIFDVKSALSEMHRVRLHWEKRFEQMVADKGMKKGALHKFMINCRKKVKGELVYRVVEDGVEISRPLEKPNGDAYSYGELIQIRNYLLDEDPDAVSRLKGGNNFSYPNQVLPGHSTLEVVEDHLDQNMKDWRIPADTAREFYSPDEFGSVVNDTVKRRYGREITPNHTYGGQLLSDADATGSRETFRRMSNRPATKRRQGGTKRVEIRDAFDNLRSHIAQYAREGAMFELEQDLPATFGRQDIKDRISRDVGDNTNKVISAYITDIVFGQRQAQNMAEKIITHLSNSLYVTFLGARPEQAAKQLSGAVHALQFVGPKEILDGYAYMLANPDGAHELMNKSGTFQDRKQGKSPDFKPGVIGNINRFNEFSTNSIKVGDEYATAGAAFPVLLAKLAETGSEVEALKAFETAFDTTQS